MHDMLRMIAYRAESAMAMAVAPELDNPETARSLLKALAPLIDQLNRTRTVVPGTPLRLVYELLPDEDPAHSDTS